METRVAVICAVPHEAAALLARMRNVRSERIAGVAAYFGFFGEAGLAVMAAGMGQTAAGPARALIETMGNIERLWVAGYGGGLDPSLRRGDVVVAPPAGFDVPRAPALRRGCAMRQGRVACVAAIAATAGEKRRLFEETGALCCEMESEVIGPIAEARGIPWGSVRAISDAASDDLPARLLDAGWDAHRRRPSPLRLIQSMVRHPGEAPAFLRFVAGLGLARENLGRVLVAVAGGR